MKLATRTGDFFGYTKSAQDSLGFLREAGFRYADYSFGDDFSTRTGIYADFERHVYDVAQTADKLGMRLVQAHSPMGKPLAEDNAAFIEDTVRCVDACGAWGIPNLVVHSGYAYGLSVEETFARNKEFFAPILARAEKYGVNILVENFNKMHTEGVYWIDNAPDLLAMIEYVDHPLFHAVWDTGHGNLQEMPQHEALALLGSHVRALHIQDNLGDRDTHLMPFFGTLNLDDVMHGLADIDYKGYFTFEIGGIFLPAAKRRPFEKDTRLCAPSLDLRRHMERYIFEMGKYILTAYDCFEE
ncbi:MAG: sugar phosphate isomerase/epimerase [Ruminococcaceae bacterium]|nr:sugar phosphate isomerase/epimerase [Oscillospiraceae bacterium]